MALPPFPSAEVEAAAKTPPPGVLWREDVDAVVEQGLGAFLQRVSVEPSLEGGAFVGWEIRDLRPQEQWQVVDLRPGDVVTAINGRPIERDQEAYAAFQGLLESPELRVTVLRVGEPRELVFRILPRSEGAATASARPSGSTAPAPRAAASSAAPRASASAAP